MARLLVDVPGGRPQAAMYSADVYDPELRDEDRNVYSLQSIICTNILCFNVFSVARTFHVVAARFFHVDERQIRARMP